MFLMPCSIQWTISSVARLRMQTCVWIHKFSIVFPKPLPDIQINNIVKSTNTFHICAYVYMPICICVHLYICCSHYVCICIYMCVYNYVYIYKYIYTYLYIYMYLFACIYTHVWMYVCMCIKCPKIYLWSRPFVKSCTGA